MAKGRKREKSRKAGPGAAPVQRPDRQAVAARDTKRHLRRLERLLAEAAKEEGKRIRKLERARWRRQRLEAELAVIRGAPIAAGPAKAVAVRATPAKATPAKATPAKAAAAKPVTSRAANKPAAPKAAPAKPASPRRPPSSRSTSAGTGRSKASPGDRTAPKT
jgi:hypothetical protein